jgi:glycosyltransferase involved in cell wall biosynthesis
VHTAFLPVNEHNFFKERRGILGNMSVREAMQFAHEIAASQVVAVHWDMFRDNAVSPEEIRLVRQQLGYSFRLLINPTFISFAEIHVSLIIRTLNEARHLDELLSALARQQTNGLRWEVVLVDSGSTDGTLEIAASHACRIHHITREEFSFGRSLNIGCAAARGDILVITSGHCVPVGDDWLRKLCQPIFDGVAEYTYGGQRGGDQSHFSECRIFAKYFPQQSAIPQADFFCNNANSALARSAWEQHRFDEELTGLEDMALAQKLVQGGGKIAYIADAPVFHYHSESWEHVRRRFEREAIALQRIMPQVHVGPFDLVRYLVSSVWKDWRHAYRNRVFRANALEIVLYRLNQYLGTFKGNHQHRKLSHAEKEKYFYPH